MAGEPALTRCPLRVLVVVFAYLMLVPGWLSAQVVIAPGDQIVEVPEGTSGERPGLFIDCPLCRSDHSPSTLRAVARRDLPGNSRVGLFMSREFQVSSALSESEVEGLIRISFSLKGTLSAAGALARSLYSVHVVLTDLETGRSIAASPVTSSLRQGASVNVTFPNSPVAIPIPDPQTDLVDTTFTHLLRANVRRGHRYQIVVDFEVRAQVEDSILDPLALTAFAGSNFFGNGGLTWTSCLVSLAPDAFEQLSTQLSAHDVDIKRELENIKAQLRALEELLLTPEGRRPGFPKK